MKTLHGLIALAALALTASCSTAPPGVDGRMMIVSREWINPSLRDIHATVDVRRIDPIIYSLNYSFSVPLDPVNGVNPSEFHFFTFCLSSNLAKQAQRSHWALGSREKDMKYQNTKSLEFFVATLNEGELPPATTKDSNPIFWAISSMKADNQFESCSRMIRSEHMWTVSSKSAPVAPVTVAATSTSPPPEPTRQVAQLTRQALMELGARSYQEFCAACHQQSGSGVSSARISSLHQSKVVNDSNRRYLRFVMFNEPKMQHPAWYLAMSPAALASALTYIRVQFPNTNQALVQPSEVIAELAKLSVTAPSVE